MWCDWKDAPVKLETMVIEELIPHIDGSYRRLAKREGRIIEGFSMGGYGAARLGFNLKIPHTYRQLPGIPHNPNLVLETLGEENWRFYMEALAALDEARTQMKDHGLGP